MAECSDQRQVYLVTYSRADLEKVKTREDFADIWVRAFGREVVQQWACCCEKHKEEPQQVHFHLSIKLKTVRRWKQVKANVTRSHGIVCHFQEFPANYYDAYRYVTKEDPDYITSEGHPLLTNSPQSKPASAKRKAIRAASDVNVRPAVPKKKAVTKLDVMDLYHIIVTNNINTERELFVLANLQKNEGKMDLLKFILTISDKRRCEIIRNAWRVENSMKENDRLKLTAIQILQEARKKPCVCAGDYYIHVGQTLEQNNIDANKFREAVTNALRYGRKKGNNVMLIGPANCGKTFVLQPLTEIYNSFVSPASGTFPWVGAEKAEVVFLNDLRWNEKLMPWGDFLNLLEGLPVHISAPKTHYAEDLLWVKKTPIFGTSSTRIRKYDGGIINDRETAMMECRWKYFEFTKPVEDPKDIVKCSSCFAHLILGY